MVNKGKLTQNEMLFLSMERFDIQKRAVYRELSTGQSIQSKVKLRTVEIPRLKFLSSHNYSTELFLTTKFICQQRTSYILLRHPADRFFIISLTFGLLPHTNVGSIYHEKFSNSIRRHKSSISDIIISQALFFYGNCLFINNEALTVKRWTLQLSVAFE